MISEKKRCVIIGGADIGNYDALRKILRAEDYVIFCDCGLAHRERLGADPDLIVGDFDSFDNPLMDVETIILPREKDDTDTFFAVKEGIKRGFCEFLLIGVVGNRLDHTLGNVSILLYLDSVGKHGVIADNYSQMELVSGKAVDISDAYSYFSLLNISGTARGITIENAKFPLSDGEITCEYQYGISNEVIPGKTASVTVKEGNLLLIKVI